MIACFDSLGHVCRSGTVRFYDLGMKGSQQAHVLKAWSLTVVLLRGDWPTRVLAKDGFMDEFVAEWAVRSGA
jgi:hypothetical protein